MLFFPFIATCMWCVGRTNVRAPGHQGTNMISSVDLYNVANDVRFPRDHEIVAEAVKNLREEVGRPMLLPCLYPHVALLTTTLSLFTVHVDRPH